MQVRNEIAVLKRVSQGHKNIVTLHDYFEVSNVAHHPTSSLMVLFSIRPPTISTSFLISAQEESCSIVYALRAITTKRMCSRSLYMRLIPHLPIQWCCRARPNSVQGRKMDPWMWYCSSRYVYLSSPIHSIVSNPNPRIRPCSLRHLSNTDPHAFHYCFIIWQISSRRTCSSELRRKTPTSWLPILVSVEFWKRKNFKYWQRSVEHLV